MFTQPGPHKAPFKLLETITTPRQDDDITKVEARVQLVLPEASGI
jgi:hypothetical protein